MTWTPIFFQGQDEGLVGLPFVNPLIFDLIYIEDDRLPPFKHELHLNAVELFVKLWCTKSQSLPERCVTFRKMKQLEKE